MQVVVKHWTDATGPSFRFKGRVVQPVCGKMNSLFFVSVACLLFVGVNSRAVDANLLSAKNNVKLSSRQTTCSAQPLIIFNYDTNSFTNLLGGDSGVDGTGGYTISGGVAKWTPTVTADAYWFTDLYNEAAASGLQCTNVQSKFGTDATLSVTLGKTTSAAAKVTVGINLGCDATNNFVLLGYASLGTGTVSSVFSFKIAPALSTATDLQKIKAVVFLAENGNVPAGAALTIDNLQIGCGTSVATTTTTPAKSSTTTTPKASTTTTTSKASTTATSTKASTTTTTTKASTTTTTTKASTTTSSSLKTTTTTVTSPKTTTTTSTTTKATTTSATKTTTTSSVTRCTANPLWATEQAALPGTRPQVVSQCKTPGVFALTFDDGPFMYEPTLLQKLDAAGVKATFFINGDNYVTTSDQPYAGWIQNLYNSGHQIASHTMTHPDLATLSVTKIQQELTNLETVIFNIIGKKPAQLRPPFGSFNANVLKVADSLGYNTIALWNVDTDDHETDNATTSMQNMVNALETLCPVPGSVAALSLAHSPLASSTTFVDLLIPYVKSRGYRFVTLSECVGAPAYK
ncbi:hypothetical protein HK098_006058 [Nowakowskiella sp. JEL0407]|nr:hypothetical protein HK098_006058 [Nowakowskiella sp. JEL0407]